MSLVVFLLCSGDLAIYVYHLHVKNPLIEFLLSFIILIFFYESPITIEYKFNITHTLTHTTYTHCAR
jgi:hypothetical protein